MSFAKWWLRDHAKTTSAFRFCATDHSNRSKQSRQSAITDRRLGANSDRCTHPRETRRKSACAVPTSRSPCIDSPALFRSDRPANRVRQMGLAVHRPGKGSRAIPHRWLQWMDSVSARYRARQTVGGLDVSNPTGRGDGYLGGEWHDDRG